MGTSPGSSELAASEPSISTRSFADEERGSLSSESYVHANLAASSSSGGEDQKSDKTKSQLWHDLKISCQYTSSLLDSLHLLTCTALTRTFTLIYTVSLLSLLTRIQLNLLGRRSYLASIVAHTSADPQDQTIKLEDRDENNPQAPVGDEFEVNRQYLTFSWFLLHKGWKDIMLRVEAAVTGVFGSVKPTAEITSEQFSSLVLAFRGIVEGANQADRR